MARKYGMSRRRNIGNQFDVPAMLCDDFAAEGKPQARAIRARGVKQVKKMHPIRRRNSRTGIAYQDFDSAGQRTGFDK